MARLFILFLIALLPLRGWTAERMVFAVAQEHAVVAALAHHDDSAADMPADCALHMQMATDGAQHPHDGGTPSHSGCESCQLCMPLVAAADVHAPALPAGPQAQPATGVSRFDSAEPALFVKPPIS